MTAIKAHARRAWKWFWIATTPLALTLLLAGTTHARAHQAEAGGDAPPAAEVPAGGEGEHEYVVENPIQNFASFSYQGKDVLGQKMTPEDPLPKMPPPFSMALVNFGILLFLFGKAAGPGIGRYVRDRHENIAKALSEGQRLREEAQRKVDEYGEKLKSLDAEIAALVATIKSEGEAEKKRIIAEAEVRAERMKRDAEQQIQAEIQRVRTTLEREAVEAAVGIAQKVLREKMNETDQRGLADKFVKNLHEVAGKGRLIA